MKIKKRINAEEEEEASEGKTLLLFFIHRRYSRFMFIFRCLIEKGSVILSVSSFDA